MRPVRHLHLPAAVRGGVLFAASAWAADVETALDEPLAQPVSEWTLLLRPTCGEPWACRACSAASS